MYATPGLLRMFLDRGNGLEVIYAGDRMWPAVAHGEHLQVTPLKETGLPIGAVVVAVVDGVPDLLRVAANEGDNVVLQADADPGPPSPVQRGALIARADRPVVPGAHRGAGRRRLFLDLREALAGQPDDPTDPARTVLEKYDRQAPYYAAVEGDAVEPSLLERIRRRVRQGGTILVIGSGTGREALGLAEEGWRVSGVDFSAAMIDIARQEAKRRDLDVSFHQADLLEHHANPGSLSAVVFTYEVYSFLPDPRRRRELLMSLSRWLEPGGCVFLSARRPRGLYDRCILTAQWIRRGARPERWGCTHTRWIASDGSMRRSFVQLHTSRSIRREVRRAGLSVGLWEGGHVVLERRGASPAGA